MELNTYETDADLDDAERGSGRDVKAGVDPSGVSAEDRQSASGLEVRTSLRFP